MTFEEATGRLAARAARDPLLAPLARAARDRGWRVWLVGGFVRDLLLGRNRAGRDVDLVVGEPRREILAWLAERSGHAPVTFAKRVVDHRMTIAGRELDAVELDERPLIEELARRDFKANAVAFDLAAAALEDPLGGVADLAAGALDPPRDDAFADDPLRLLRGPRIAAEIPALALTPRARALAARDAALLAGAAPERVVAEIDRMLLAPRPSRAVAELDALGLAEVVLPEIAAARGVAQNRHHHLDVWGHTLAALAAADRPRLLGRGVVPPERLPAGERLATLRWALLLHDLGKPATRAVRPNGEASFFRHEVVGAEIAERIAKRLCFGRARAAALTTLVRLHLRLVVPAEGLLSRRALGRIAREAGDAAEPLALHALADQAASRGVGHRAVRAALRETCRRFLAVRDELAAARAAGPLVDGRAVMRALGVAEGPEVGAALREIEELRLAGRLKTADDALAYLAARRR